MSHLYRKLGPQSVYVDRRSGLSTQAWRERLRHSTCVYVGNLAFTTAENQIFELFSKCGAIECVVMGLNAKKKYPCGFCFVLFSDHASANRAVDLLNGVLLDGRVIRVDWDTGESILDPSRRFGRGVHGLQWRDEFRQDFDPGRGGYGGRLDYQTFTTASSMPYPSKRRRQQNPPNNNNQQQHWDRYAKGTSPTQQEAPPPPPALRPEGDLKRELQVGDSGLSPSE